MFLESPVFILILVNKNVFSLPVLVTSLVFINDNNLGAVFVLMAQKRLPKGGFWKVVSWVKAVSSHLSCPFLGSSSIQLAL